MMLVMLSYVMASWIRLDFFDGESGNMAAVSYKTVLLALGYGMVLFMLMSILGFYNTTRTRRLSWKIRTIVICVTMDTLLATSLLFVFRLIDFSRGVVLAFYLFTNLFLIAKYAFMRLVLSRFRNHGYNLKHVVVIGTGRLAEQFRDDIARDPALGFRIKGFISPDTFRETCKASREKEESHSLEKENENAENGEWRETFFRITELENRGEYLGNLSDLDTTLQDANEAVIALGPSEYGRIQEIISICERNGVRYSVIPFYNDIIPTNPVIDTIGRSKLINMRSNRLENVGWSMLKRSFDVLASSLGLIILSPLLIFIAIGVKKSSPGPVFFRQTRVGYERKEFEMLKFRSMRVNDASDTAWTQTEDSRRTAFGSFLRKTSLDELPQLFNVLKGDMSLVGPRPELPYFVEQFREKIPFYMVKHQVKPGMTGWAQVKGYRGDTSIEKRIKLDLWYIDNWSVWLDIRILLKTFMGGMLNKEELYRKRGIQ